MTGKTEAKKYWHPWEYEDSALLLWCWWKHRLIRLSSTFWPHLTMHQSLAKTPGCQQHWTIHTHERDQVTLKPPLTKLDSVGVTPLCTKCSGYANEVSFTYTLEPTKIFSDPLVETQHFFFFFGLMNQHILSKILAWRGSLLCGNHINSTFYSTDTHTTLGEGNSDNLKPLFLVVQPFCTKNLSTIPIYAPRIPQIRLLVAAPLCLP